MSKAKEPEKSLEELTSELFAAIKDKKITEIEFLHRLLAFAKAMPSNFTVNDPIPAAGGRSLVALAAMYGRPDILHHLKAIMEHKHRNNIEQLKHFKVDVNRVTPHFLEGKHGEYIPVRYSGYTPLHYAAMNGKASSVKWLLENGADPNAHVKGPHGIILEENEDGPPSPLRIGLKYPNVVKLLISGPIPAYIGNEVCEAIHNGYVETVRVMVKHPGIDVNMACTDDDDGSTLLYAAGRVAYYAAKNKNTALREKAEDIFQLLLDAGADLSIHVEDPDIKPEEEGGMTIREHALKGHFTPRCLEAMVKHVRSAAQGRRRHLLTLRHRPARANRANAANVANAPNASKSKSKSKSGSKSASKSEGRGAGAGAGSTRRKSRNNE
jgi:hypothetical protein